MEKVKYDVIVSLANKNVPKEIAISLLGTAGQRKNFESNGKLTGGANLAFKSRLERMYEEVDTSIRGKVILGAALPEEDITITESRGGNNESGYTKYMDVIILMALENNMFTEHSTTMNRWVYNFGLVNNILYNLKSAPFGKESLEFKEQLKEDGILNSDHQVPEMKLFMDDYEKHKRSLERVLHRMDRENLINFYKVPKVRLAEPIKIGETDDGDIFTDVITADESMEKLITTKQKELRQELRLETKHLTPAFRKTASEEMKQKLKKYDEELTMFYKTEEKMGVEIKYFWFNYAITVKATTDDILKYIKEKRPEFYHEYATDKEMFFNNSKENYIHERKKKLLKDMFDKADRVFQKKLIEHEENSKLPAFSSEKKIPKLEQNRIENYWKNAYSENVQTMEPLLRPDFIQRINK